MAAIITIDRWINEPSVGHTNDKVVVYATIIGSGNYIYIPEWTCYSEEFQRQWIRMTPLTSDPRHTPTPITVAGTRHIVFVWDASTDGVHIVDVLQRHQFALALRDITCNTGGGRTGEIIPDVPPIIPPRPPDRRRTPTDPAPPIINRPPGPRPRRNPNVPIFRRPPVIITNGPIIPIFTGGRTGNGGNTVTVTGSPTTPSFPRNGGGGPTTRTGPTSPITPGGGPGNRGGVTRTPTDPGVINTPRTPSIGHTGVGIVGLPGGGFRGDVGSVVSSPQGPVTIPPGGPGLERTGDQTEIHNPNVGRPWGRPTIGTPIPNTPVSLPGIGNRTSVSVSGSQGLEQLIDQGLNFPMSIDPGDPDPYRPGGNISFDYEGTETSPGENQMNFLAGELGIGLSSTFIESLNILYPVPSLKKTPWGRDFMEVNIVAVPRHVSRGENITITCSAKNTNDSAPIRCSQSINVVSPSGRWYEIVRDIFVDLGPESVMNIGRSFNALSLNETGVWRAVNIIYSPVGEVISFDMEPFVVYPAGTIEGADPSTLGSIGAGFSNFRVGISGGYTGQVSLDANPVTQFSLSRGPSFLSIRTISQQHITSTSPVCNIYFDNPTSKTIIVNSTGELSLTLSNDKWINSSCSLLSGNFSSILSLEKSNHISISSHSGPLDRLYGISREALINPVSIGDPSSLPYLPLKDKEFGGIPLDISLTSGDYILSISPDNAPVYMKAFLGGNSLTLKSPSVISSSRSGNTWTITAQLSFGNEYYKVFVGGGNPSKIPSGATTKTVRTSVNGTVTFSIDGSLRNYIHFVRMGSDGIYRPSVSTELVYRLV